MLLIIQNLQIVQNSKYRQSTHSVEGAEDGRVLNAYEEDDDFLNTNCDTEDIEIF